MSTAVRCGHRGGRNNERTHRSSRARALILVKARVTFWSIIRHLLFNGLRSSQLSRVKKSTPIDTPFQYYTIKKGQVLWDRNPGFLKSEIGPFSDFNRKSYLMDSKSAHSQESDFQESGEVDRFLKMGTHFQERSGSLENGLCVTWSGFWLRPWYLCGF